MSAPETLSSVSGISSMLVDELNQLILSETDVELLEKYVQCRDRVAMERLIVRYGPMVYSVCRATASCRSDAEDAFQATFLVLIQSATKVRKQSSLAAWLHGVAYRTASRTRFRSQRMRDQQIDAGSFGLEQLPADQIDPITLVAKQIELEWLFKELEQLPQNLKSALVEHYLYGYSAKEISERMEISVSAVEGRLKRGRQMLRSKLIRHGLSLSVALGAVEILKSKVQAAESNILVLQFCTQQLPLESLVKSPNSLSPNVNELIQGEIAMLKKSLLMKTALSAIAFGSLGTVTVLALWDDGNGAGKAAGKQTQTVTVSAPSSEVEVSKIPAVVLGQGRPAPGGQPVPSAPSSAVPGQPSQPSQPSASPNLISVSPNSQVQLQAAQANQKVANQASQNAAQAAPNTQLVPLGGGARRGASTPKEPAPIVKWKAPEGNKPSWMTSGPDSEKIEYMKDQVKIRFRDTICKDGFNFQSTPLNRAFSSIGDELKIRVFLNMAELDEEGIQAETPVTLELPECSYREAIELMLKPLGLSYRIREFGLEITTAVDVDDSDGVIRTYDLSYLYSDSSNVDALINTILNSIEPDSWTQNGGSSSISVVGSMLVVSCPDSTHYKIEDLLRAISKMSPSNSTPKVTIEPMGVQQSGGFF
ncbi:MAG: sigma-70 family RNA polymerase sigma factor [Pirellulales bacterium]